MPFQKGQTPWNKNLKLPYDVWNKGVIGVVKQTPETIAKRVKKLKGKECSLETRKKISIAQKGQKGYWFGHKRSAGDKKVISDKLKGRTPWNKGKKWPERSGANNHNWKGGIWKANLREIIEKHFKSRQWKCDILQRDNYTCQHCGKNKITLDIHHITPFSVIIHKYSIKTVEQALMCDELWNINNGISLCRDCHKKTDSYGGKLLTKKK